MRQIHILLPLMLVACGGGELEIKYADDSGSMSTSDTAVTTDMGVSNSDTATSSDTPITTPDVAVADTAQPPMCAPGDCGPGASCQNNVCACDDGLLGDPLVGCSMANPCANSTCSDGSSCNPDGSCSCDPFFSGDPATGCTPTPPAADLAARTATEVCAIWNDDFARSSQDFWLVEPADTCDPGVMHPDELRNALHETSRYRMLVGLNPVSLNTNALVNVQDCAMMHAANGGRLNHEPPDTWPCYTQAGYGGCSSSNLAGGLGDPAGTVRVYIQENGNADTLGHRRWIFNPRMGQTAFGHRGSFGSMYAFDQSRSHSPEFVAYPAPGPFPRAAITGPWTIHGGANYTNTHTVAITNMTDNSDVPVSAVNSPVFGSLASTLAWTVQTTGLPVDTTYRITIRDGAGALVREYDTTLVACQ